MTSCITWGSASTARPSPAVLVRALQESLAKEDTDDKLHALGDRIDSAAATMAAQQRAGLVEAHGQVLTLTARVDQVDAQSVSRQEAAAQAVQSQLAHLLRDLQGDVEAVSQDLQVWLGLLFRLH